MVMVNDAIISRHIAPITESIRARIIAISKRTTAIICGILAVFLTRLVSPLYQNTSLPYAADTKEILPDADLCCHHLRETNVCQFQLPRLKSEVEAVRGVFLVHGSFSSKD